MRWQESSPNVYNSRGMVPGGGHMSASGCTYVHVQADIALVGESQARRQILERFFSRPGVVRHVRELARELDRSPTIVGAELDRLERTGVPTSERVGRARVFRGGR